MCADGNVTYKTLSSMRTFITFLFGLISLTTFGQKEIRKAYILVDGKVTSYEEYKKLDLTKFATVTVLAGNKENVRLFGKKAKKGVVHLRTREFNDNQIELLKDLKAEFDENRIETTLIVINGVPY